MASAILRFSSAVSEANDHEGVGLAQLAVAQSDEERDQLIEGHFLLSLLMRSTERWRLIPSIIDRPPSPHNYGYWNRYARFIRTIWRVGWSIRGVMLAFRLAQDLDPAFWSSRPATLAGAFSQIFIRTFQPPGRSHPCYRLTSGRFSHSVASWLASCASNMKGPFTT